MVVMTRHRREQRAGEGTNKMAAPTKQPALSLVARVACGQDYHQPGALTKRTSNQRGLQEQGSERGVGVGRFQAKQS